MQNRGTASQYSVVATGSTLGKVTIRRGKLRGRPPVVELQPLVMVTLAVTGRGETGE